MDRPVPDHFVVPDRHGDVEQAPGAAEIDSWSAREATGRIVAGVVTCDGELSGQ
jgi:hypothetical protein